MDKSNVESGWRSAEWLRDLESSQKFDGFAGHEFIIEKPHVGKVAIIADEMGGRAIDGAEEKDCVVGIHRIVPEVEKTDFNKIRQKEESGDERFDFDRSISLFQQFFGILGCNVYGDEPAEFTICPAIDDFLVRTERIGRVIGREDDIGIQNGT